MTKVFGCEHIESVGAEHPDRELFDCLMPLPYGTTYNSFLVRGTKKNALVDPVDPVKTDVLMDNLESAGVDRIDYIVCLHTEQDHAGSIWALLKRWPDARVVVNEKVRDLMITHLHMPMEHMDVVTEEDVLDLGERTLRFFMIPFAHWPDNFMAYCEQEGVLFSSDLFGSHFSTQDAEKIADDEQLSAARSYYSEIMMPYSKQIAKHTARVRTLAPRIIAPSHGPAWLDPNRILSAYETWIDGAVCRKATIPFVSMHGSTAVMARRLADGLRARGVEVSLHDLGSHPDSLVFSTGHLIYDLVDSAVILLGTPTVLVGPHPAAVYAAITAAAMKPKTKLFGIFGSFGWGSKAAETIESLTGNLGSEHLDPLMIKGLPNETDLAVLDAYAKDVADRLDAMGIQ